jgi:hypothetical protein
LREDHVQTHELGGCERDRVVDRGDRLELALEDVARNRPSCLDAHRRIDRQ